MKSRFLAYSCAVKGVDAVAADSDRSFPKHTHDQFGLGYIVRGAQQSASGVGSVEAQAGNVISVNPGEVHDGSPIGGGGRAWRMVYLDPHLVWAAGLDVSEHLQGQIEFQRPVIGDPRLLGKTAALFDAVTSPHTFDVAMPMEELLLSILPHMAEVTVPKVKGRLNITRALQRINDDPASSLSLEDLAHLTGGSRFQVLRAFTMTTGLSPHAYLMQKRLQLSRRLMRAGRPLAEVALEAGFADQSHMSRLFLRTFGFTPSSYAKAHRSDARSSA